MNHYQCSLAIKPKEWPARETHYANVALPYIPTAGLAILFGCTLIQVESVTYFADEDLFRLVCRVVDSERDDLTLSWEETAADIAAFARKYPVRQDLPK